MTHLGSTSAEIGSPMQRYLEQLHARFAPLRDGEVATYIPELGKADPEWFGIAVATVDGHVYEVGDSRQSFTIQSISKPFTYGMALEDWGLERVLEKVGAEPSGEAFNSIRLEPGTGRPYNPMVNAGAIATASLVCGKSSEDRFERLRTVYSLYAGRPLSLDESVYRSERDTGHRNRAIGHLLRNFDIVEDEPESHLDLYFRQCSIAVDSRDLSLMAACLANGGVHPRTGERALRQEYVQHVLSLMTTCGMYDYAGEWVFWVGMPAKSGVAGGVLAVLPGQLGIGVFSPRLDPRGNSARGVAVCRELSHNFNLHFLTPPRSARASIRAEYDAATVSSKRLRTPAQRSILDRDGDAAAVFNLTGDLVFATVELLMRRILDGRPRVQFVIVNLESVTSIDPAVTVLFLQFQLDLATARREILFVGLDRHARFRRALEESLAQGDAPTRLRAFPDVDRALEWCEDRILERAGVCEDGRTVSLEDHGLCSDLTESELDILRRHGSRQTYRAGARILSKGDPADRFFLLLHGQVSVMVDLPQGRQKRLSTLTAGLVFGEFAIIDGTPRSADVRADTAIECFEVTLEGFAALGREFPAVQAKILKNLLRGAAQIVVRLNHEVAALAR